MRKKCSVSAEEMFEIDRISSQEYGIPSLLLMENAGRAVFSEAVRMLKKSGAGRRQEIICVCGKGNNGGDGFVCARHLFNSGFNVKVFVTAEPESITGDARLNIEILRRMSVDAHVLKSSEGFNAFKKTLKNASLIIDAIFGIGFKGCLAEPQKTIIGLINRSKRPVLSVDIPSGLNATSGEFSGACVRAERTVTFALPKRGLLTACGRRQAGKIIAADISIPRILLCRYQAKQLEET